MLGHDEVCLPNSHDLRSGGMTAERGLGPFTLLHRNDASIVRYFCLPRDRIVEIGSVIEIQPYGEWRCSGPPAPRTVGPSASAVPVTGRPCRDVRGRWLPLSAPRRN
jgi:hypothetical protein